jgi:hypothetical protein
VTHPISNSFSDSCKKVNHKISEDKLLVVHPISNSSADSLEIFKNERAVSENILY